jgi:hypothetical protein
MSNHLHVVLKTPEPNLARGVSAQWNHTPPAPQRRPVAPVGDGRRNAAPRSHGYESRQRSVVTAGPILVHPGEARADI